MHMSQTYIAQIVIVLALILPKIGVNLGNDELTALAQGAVILGGIVWTLVRRYQVGDITAAGIRKG